MKIVVYAICKNEEQFVERWMDSMSEADQVVVLDTGSTDESVRRLRDRGALVTEEAVVPWRFDTARNRSLELTPEDADICVCTDLDEVFHPGWRAALERAWRPGASQASYRYTWSFNPDGSEGVVFWAEKIHTRRGWRWVHPVHEVLQWTGGGSPGVKVTAEGIQLDHHPDPSKSRGQYLPLLELSVEEDPADDRNMHYLGREYMYKGRWDDCIAALRRHLSMPTAVWRDERAASMRYIARSLAGEGPGTGICGPLSRRPICGSPIWIWPCSSTGGRTGTACSTSPAAPWLSGTGPGPISARPPAGAACPTICGPSPSTIQAALRRPQRRPGGRRSWSPPASGCGTTRSCWRIWRKRPPRRRQILPSQEFDISLTLCSKSGHDQFFFLGYIGGGKGGRPMTKKHPYPHQLKYRITPADYTALRTRLSAAALEEGRSVHTLLFDSYRGRVPALTSGDAGLDIPADPRFSLHYFDDDPTYLLLERRQDQRSDGTMVTEAECRALLAGETDWLLDRRNPVLRDFHSSLTRRMLLPRVLLSYQREVYALEELDLWVALDTDIRTTLQHMDFLDPDLLARDTAGLTGQMLMEISYSSVIPDDILCLLEETAPRRRLLA